MEPPTRPSSHTESFQPTGIKRKKPSSGCNTPTNVALQNIAEGSPKKKARCEIQVEKVNFSTCTLSDEDMGTVIYCVERYLPFNDKLNLRLTAKKSNRVVINNSPQKNKDHNLIHINFDNNIILALCLKYERVLTDFFIEFVGNNHKNASLDWKKSLIPENAPEELKQLMFDLATNPKESSAQSPLYQAILQQNFIQCWIAFQDGNEKLAMTYVEEAVRGDCCNAAFIAVLYFQNNPNPEFDDKVKKLAIDAARLGYYNALDWYLIIKESFDEQLYNELKEFPSAEFWKGMHARENRNEKQLKAIKSYPINPSLTLLRYCLVEDTLNLIGDYLDVLSKYESTKNGMGHLALAYAKNADSIWDLSSGFDYAKWESQKKMANHFYMKVCEGTSWNLGFGLVVLENMFTFYLQTNFLTNREWNFLDKVVDTLIEKIDDTEQKYSIMPKIAIIKIHCSKYDEAEEIYSALGELSRDNAFLVARGKRLLGKLDTKYLEEALEILNKSELRWTRAWNFERGMCFKILGQHDEAYISLHDCVSHTLFPWQNKCLQEHYKGQETEQTLKTYLKNYYLIG